MDFEMVRYMASCTRIFYVNIRLPSLRKNNWVAAGSSSKKTIIVMKQNHAVDVAITFPDVKLIKTVWDVVKTGIHKRGQRSLEDLERIRIEVFSILSVMVTKGDCKLQWC